MLTIGIDVGGTFTDLVAIDASGRTVFAKSLSTPQDQSIGVMAGLDELARRLIGAGIRLVTVTWGGRVNNPLPHWDTHFNNKRRLRDEPPRGRSEAVEPVLADADDCEPAFASHGAAH